jgi:hypothetical protein
MATEHWVEGETGARRYTLKAGNDPINLAGLTVELVLVRHKDPDTVVDTTGDVSIVTAAAGLVQFSPDAGDMLAANSPMLARFKLTDVDGKVAYLPEGEPDVWLVRIV